jgi:hypothetical protein
LIDAQEKEEMSNAAVVRARRAVKRRVGKKRCTRQELLNEACVRALRRIVKETGAKIVEETAGSVEVDYGDERTCAILRQEGFIEAGPGNWLHRKMRLSDFCRAGISFTLVPNNAPEFVFDSAMLSAGKMAMKNRPELPEVSPEELEAMRRRLNTTHAIRLDQI